MHLPPPDEVAETLLDAAGQTGPPVDLQCVIQMWRTLAISEEDLAGEGYLIDMGALGAEIVVRARSNAARKRYTIAHELGHWVLKLGAGLPLDGVPNQYRATVERWCDRFAASVLLPREWLLDRINSSHYRAIGTLLSEGPRQYQVSEQAFYLRLCEVADAAVYEIVESVGRLKVVAMHAGPSTPAWSTTLTASQMQFLLVGEAQRLMTLPSGHQCVFAWCVRQKATSRLKWVTCVVPTDRLPAALSARDSVHLEPQCADETSPYTSTGKSDVTIDFIQRAERHRLRLRGSSDAEARETE